nr:hypothetical protein [Tanacetum cinerariifolium]
MINFVVVIVEKLVVVCLVVHCIVGRRLGGDVVWKFMDGGSGDGDADIRGASIDGDGDSGGVFVLILSRINVEGFLSYLSTDIVECKIVCRGISYTIKHVTETCRNMGPVATKTKNILPNDFDLIFHGGLDFFGEDLFVIKEWEARCDKDQMDVVLLIVHQETSCP